MSDSIWVKRRAFIQGVAGGLAAAAAPILITGCATASESDNLGAARSAKITANGIRLHYLEQGSGPLVLLCHGFPETSYSWRNQISALAAAGYRVVAPDMRGYGKSGQPQGIDAYTNITLVNDMVGLLDALNEKNCAIIGHDWGANVAWNASLIRPDRFRSVAALSVPFTQRPAAAPLANLRRAFAERFFYILYFQEPGVAENELGTDVAKTLRSFFYSLSAEGESKRRSLPPVEKNASMLDTLVDPGQPPSWMRKDELDHYVEEFTRNGFRGPLNWYRNIDRNWELLAPYAQKKVEVPALFIGGDKDPVVQFSKAAINALPQNVPGLVKSEILADCGHWIQQEKPKEVNHLLIEFLKRHYG